jgi:uncharacterized protein (TIGR03086 family)
MNTTLEPTRWPVLAEAHTALRAAVLGVGQAWNLPTPCELWTVTQVLRHALGDQTAYTSVLTGGPMPDEDPFAPSETALADATARVDAVLGASAAAWDAVPVDGAPVPTPLPQGTLAPATAAGACALDAAVHAWDIAVATGQPSPLRPELARTLLPVAHEIVELLRAYGAYAAALDPEPGDDDAAALLRYLGRNPAWAPTDHVRTPA